MHIPPGAHLRGAIEDRGLVNLNLGNILDPLLGKTKGNGGGNGNGNGNGNGGGNGGGTPPSPSPTPAPAPAPAPAAPAPAPPPLPNNPSPAPTSPNSPPPPSDPSPAPPQNTQPPPSNGDPAPGTPTNNDPGSPNPSVPDPSSPGGTTHLTPVLNSGAAPTTNRGNNNPNVITQLPGAPISTDGPLATSSAQVTPGGTGAISGGTDSGASDGSGHHLSSGALAGILIICLIPLLALTFFCVRKRAILRRTERRSAWWRRRGNIALAPSPEPQSPRRARASVRSSFATTVDYALAPPLTLDFAPGMPPLPNMTETGGQRNLLSAPSSIHDPFSADAGQGVNRLSATSLSGETADSHTQYLYVTTPLIDTADATTPMSVRPFSPSEAFSFPKPPKEGSSSRPGSALTTKTTATPFSPTSTTNTAVDPFGDQGFVASPDPIEVVRRPFVPTRHDELPVAVSDSVRVLRIFDDGWALVERMSDIKDISSRPGAESPNSMQVGLIPLDCFRPSGQDLPSFLSEKRVSVPAYAANNEMHMGSAM